MIKIAAMLRSFFLASFASQGKDPIIDPQ